MGTLLTTEQSFRETIKRFCNWPSKLSALVDETELISNILDNKQERCPQSKLLEDSISYCQNKSLYEPDYSLLAGRISSHMLALRTESNILDYAKVAYQNSIVYCNTLREVPLIKKEVYEFIVANANALQKMIQDARDYRFTYAAIDTLKKSYLLGTKTYEENNDKYPTHKVIERPQMMYMRIAISLHFDKEESLDVILGDIKDTYDSMSLGSYTHATPTMCNAGKPKAQLSSCFLMTVDDSIKGIFRSVSNAAELSKGCGGLGIDFSSIRNKFSPINPTGTSTGLTNMLRVFQDTAEYVDQGGNNRKGAFAGFVQAHHPELLKVTSYKDIMPDEENRLRKLFFAVIIPDLLFERAYKDEKWSFFDPSVCPDLNQLYGEQYKSKYIEYEQQQKAYSSMDAVTVMSKIKSCVATHSGVYILSKEGMQKSNHSHMGTLLTSNLCTEIVQYVSKDEIASCNLASLCLPEFVERDLDTGKHSFNFDKFKSTVRLVTRNLNRVLDVTVCSIKEVNTGIENQRAISIGVSGFAEVLQKMEIPWESQNAVFINLAIFQTMYYEAMDESRLLAIKYGKWSKFEGSPTSKGFLQKDLWMKMDAERGISEYSPNNKTIFDHIPKKDNPYNHITEDEWMELRKNVIRDGLRNSLLIGLMPTASTSTIMRVSPSIEPSTSMLYSKVTQNASYPFSNHILISKLKELDLWDDEMFNAIVERRGSVQGIERIPINLRNVFKTAYEIRPSVVILLAAMRGLYVCQSQSLNLFITDPNTQTVYSLMQLSWSLGQKTLVYYLRREAPTETFNYSVKASDNNTRDKELRMSIDDFGGSCTSGSCDA